MTVTGSIIIAVVSLIQTSVLPLPKLETGPSQDEFVECKISNTEMQ